MVKMRLFRMGDKKNPIYRVVVVDSRKAATGEYIACVGHYNPTCNPAMFIGGVLLDSLITDNEREMIFSKNAKRLLNL